MRTSYTDEWATLYTGAALDVLRQLPSQSISMSVCSPPYWGLRSYLPPEHPDKGQELGTEKTPDEYVAKLVEVFGELWRVLRDDGTLWVNIGDSYASTAPNTVVDPEKMTGMHRDRPAYRRPPTPPGLKPKDLCMVPARLAIALQSWGWYLRQELVWAKDNAMPESVKDRCTRSHEYIYMLTKRPRYFYDAEAIKELARPEGSHSRGGAAARPGVDTNGGNQANGRDFLTSPTGRNARSVWRINPKPYPGAHFAVFPPELPMRCIKAGTSEKGVCSECGAPWRRVVEKTSMVNDDGSCMCGATHGNTRLKVTDGSHLRNDYGDGRERLYCKESHTVGWEPTCTCRCSSSPMSGPAEVVAATVLDPFAGSGTTLYAARKLGRRSIGIDLDEKSAELLQERFGNQGVLL